MAKTETEILEQIRPHKIPEDLGQLLDKLGYKPAEEFFDSWCPNSNFKVHVRGGYGQHFEDYNSTGDFVASTHNFIFSGYSVPELRICPDMGAVEGILNEKPSKKKLRNICDVASITLLSLGGAFLFIGTSAVISGDHHPGGYCITGGGTLLLAGGIVKGAVSLLKRDLYQTVQNMSEHKANYFYGQNALNRLRNELYYRQIQNGEITLDAYLKPEQNSEIQI